MDGVLSREEPRIWTSMPTNLKTQLLARANRDAPVSVVRIVNELKGNIEHYFDIRQMVVEAFTAEPTLLNHMFIQCGYTELEFIRDCGAMMGFVFGVLQVGLWLFYSAGWMLPTFGFVVGVISNWLALKMIFEPVRPVPCCCCQVQGLFLTRQNEVSEIYAQIVADNILSARNILKAILMKGPLTKELLEMVQEEMEESVTDFLNGPPGVWKLFRTKEHLKTCKKKLAENVFKQMPVACRHIEKYMDPEDFEGLLHPVFQQDEWKLVLMGGVLGVFV